MTKWGHACGTPACVLGHYAARRDLQDDLQLYRGHLYPAFGQTRGDLGDTIRGHFGIVSEELTILFGSRGCGSAYNNRTRAIAYLKEFIEKKWPIEEIEREPVMVGERELEPA